MIQNRFNNDFNKLLNESAPKEIAVAVSGGVDSVALLYLVCAWACVFDIKITVLIVNHNLRPDSSEEASYVSSIAKKLGCKFFELSWHCGDSKVALQERARQGRYDLMSNKCHELGINTLLTAHHLDDMLETYLMRKTRKNGVFGLSSSNNFFHNNIRILRPLFKFPKVDLIEYLQSQNIQWREDVTNKSDIYERNRVRKQIELLTNKEKEVLRHELDAVNKRAFKLNEQLVAVMAESLQINNYGFASFDIIKLQEACSDIQIQILNYILTIISGKNSVPRFRSVKKLLDKLNSAQWVKSSLHGCVLEKKGGKLWVIREKDAIVTSSIEVNLSQCWDDRFQITLNSLPDNGYLGCLSFNEYLSIKDKIDLDSLARISANNHKQILFTLPIIKNIKKVVAIPHISYYDEFDQELIKEVVFRPNFVSRFTHFL